MNGHEKELVYAWLNKQIKAYRLGNASLPDEFGTIFGVASSRDKKLQIYGLLNIIKILDIPYFRTDWDGNNNTRENYDEVYFFYKGFRVFDLVAKDESV